MRENMEELIEEAARVLKTAGAREVYVFGSVAKGEMTGHSDIDLAVTGLPPEMFFKAMSKVVGVLGRPLDLIDLDEENPFTHYLKEEGELQLVG
jgi:predicted nucleotidyltransferase